MANGNMTQANEQAAAEAEAMRDAHYRQAHYVALFKARYPAPAYAISETEYQGGIIISAYSMTTGREVDWLMVN